MKIFLALCFLVVSFGALPQAALRAQPVPTVTITSGHLVLSAAKTPAESDLLYLAEASSDLINWTSGGITTLKDDASGFQAREDASDRFLRLRYGTGDLVFATMYESVNPHQLRIDYSLDGLHWRQGGNLYPASGDDVRDPSITRINGRYYVAHTAGSYSATGNFGVAEYFSIAVSDDLTHWQHLTDVNTSAANFAVFTWAPEWFIDQDGSIYVFYCRLAGDGTYRLFYVRPTKADLTAWSAPARVGGDMLNRNAIDPQVLRVGSSYYLVYKEQGSAYLEIARGASPTAFQLWKTGDWAGWGSPREAGFLTPLGPGRWRMYYSLITSTIGDNGGNIAASDSDDDMATWSPAKATGLSGHGTLLNLRAAGNGN